MTRFKFLLCIFVYYTFLLCCNEAKHSSSKNGNFAARYTEGGSMKEDHHLQSTTHDEVNDGLDKFKFNQDRIKRIVVNKTFDKNDMKFNKVSEHYRYGGDHDDAIRNMRDIASATKQVEDSEQDGVQLIEKLLNDTKVHEPQSKNNKAELKSTGNGYVSTRKANITNRRDVLSAESKSSTKSWSKTSLKRASGVVIPKEKFSTTMGKYTKAVPEKQDEDSFTATALLPTVEVRNKSAENQAESTTSPYHITQRNVKTDPEHTYSIQTTLDMKTDNTLLTSPAVQIVYQKNKAIQGITESSKSKEISQNSSKREKMRTTDGSIPNKHNISQHEYEPTSSSPSSQMGDSEKSTQVISEVSQTQGPSIPNISKEKAVSIPTMAIISQNKLKSAAPNFNVVQNSTTLTYTTHGMWQNKTKLTPPSIQYHENKTKLTTPAFNKDSRVSPTLQVEQNNVPPVNTSLYSGVLWGDVWKSRDIRWVVKTLNDKRIKPSDRQFFHQYLPDVLAELNQTCVRFVERDERDYTILQHIDWKDPEQNVRYPTVPAPCRFGRSNGFLCVLVDDGDTCYYSSGWAQDRVQAIVEGRMSHCSRRRRLQLVTHALGLMHEHDRGDVLRHVHLHPRLRVLTGKDDLMDYRISQNNCDIFRQNKSRIPFDFESIVLHDNAFAARSEQMDYDLPLMPKNFENLPELMAYRKVGLSHFDKLKLRALYGCGNKSCENERSCENFGFRNRECRCECAPGYKGTYCQTKTKKKRDNCASRVTTPTRFFLNETSCSVNNHTFNYTISMSTTEDDRLVVNITMLTVYTLLHGMRILPDCNHARVYFNGSGSAWPRKVCADTLLMGPLTLRSYGSAAILVLVFDLPSRPKNPGEIGTGLPTPQQAIGDVRIEIGTERNPATELIVDTSRTKPVTRAPTVTTPTPSTSEATSAIVQSTRPTRKSIDYSAEPEIVEPPQPVQKAIPKQKELKGGAPLAARANSGSKTGVIVAVVIVVLLLILVVAAVGFYVYRKRKAAADEVAGEDQPFEDGGDGNVDPTAGDT